MKTVISRAARRLRGFRPGTVTMLAIAGVAAALAWWHGRPTMTYATATASRGDIEARVTAIGTLQPRRYVDVGAQVSGQITRLAVGPGDKVTQGQLLVEIDPSVQRAIVDAGRASLSALRAELAGQQAQHRLANQQARRQHQLTAHDATREQDLQTAEAALAAASARIDRLRALIAQTQATQRAEEARLGYTRIYAPMTGTVVAVDAREGQTLNATYQTPNVLRVADLSGMTVWTEVSEADIGRVKTGMPVYFTTLGGHDAAAPRRWSGTVQQVLPAPPQPAGNASGNESPTPAAATRAVVYTVLFDVDNADGELMPQMTAQVSFVAAKAHNVVTVPLAALTASTDRAGLYSARILAANGRPEARDIRVGVRSRHLAEAVEGVRAGERIVTGETVQSGLGWLQW